MLYRFDAPFGTISYAWDGLRCDHIWLNARTDAPGSHDDPVSAWLQHYFAAMQSKSPDTDAWLASNLPVLAEPATPFRARMRQALWDIPAGEVRTYGELAKVIGTAPRAMGQALGANPLPVLIPCHRVVAANGLGGFACGLAWKKALLRLEGVG